MIIGNGDIAIVLQDREGAIFFAAGVSNSQCIDNNEFTRECERFMRIVLDYPNHCLFYFSSLVLPDQAITKYRYHKLLMEEKVKHYAKNFNIIRIGNIDFGNNPNTFINYFRNCIEKGLPYKVFDEYRYLISKEELLLLTNNLPLTGRNEISVTGRIVKVQTIVDELIQEHERKIQTRQ